MQPFVCQQDGGRNKKGNTATTEFNSQKCRL